LRRIREFDEHIPVIIISEQDKVHTAVDLLREGAYDYLEKTEAVKDRLLHMLLQIQKNHQLQSRLRKLQQEVQEKYDFSATLLGKSDSIRSVFSLLEKAIGNNIPVLITGETGTGKELVAKALHYNSPRRKEPFLAVNMAAIPAELAESELFGHEKGAFTGAAAQHIGKFEQAEGGTLLLDEISEMDLSIQAKLLRVLQEKELTRVGGQKVIPIHCRIVSTSNRRMEELVQSGKFREDLYFRLVGMRVELPPLRQRGEDIVLLAQHFVDAFCAENQLETKRLAPASQTRLLAYPWPGNIRELKSVVELATVMSGEGMIHPEDILLKEPLRPDLPLHHDMTLEEYNKHLIRNYLRKYDDNVVLVADKLGIGKSTIYRMLKDDKDFFTAG